MHACPVLVVLRRRRAWKRVHEVPVSQWLSKGVGKRSCSAVRRPCRRTGAAVGPVAVKHSKCPFGSNVTHRHAIGTVPARGGALRGAGDAPRSGDVGGAVLGHRVSVPEADSGCRPCLARCRILEALAGHVEVAMARTACDEVGVERLQERLESVCRCASRSNSSRSMKLGIGFYRGGAAGRWRPCR